MDQVGLVSGKTCLVRQPGKMVNFIHEKISDYMELSQLALNAFSQSGKPDDPLPNNRNLCGPVHQTKQNVVLGMCIYWKLAEKNKHGSSKHTKIQVDKSFSLKVSMLGQNNFVFLQFSVLIRTTLQTKDVN